MAQRHRNNEAGLDSLNRRGFLKATAIAGGGLLVACGGGGGGGSDPAPIVNRDAPQDPVEQGPTWDAHAFIRIAANNVVTVIVGPSEIGQGTMTAVPMIVAEELDADWELVNWEQSPVSIEYGNPAWQGIMITAASYSIRGYWDVLRQGAAGVREMLVTAAAEQWGVDAATLQTRDSFVIDPINDRQASYGELAEAAANVSPPLFPTLKSVDEYRLIGQSKQRLDGPEKTDGSLEYGFDFEIPDMRIVMLARPPRFGDQLISFDATEALKIPGVLDVQAVLAGVAVLATDYWAAERGREALEIQWSSLLASRINTDEVRERYDLVNQLPGLIVRNDGLVETGQLGAAASLEQDYYFPYLTHAPMEPLNVVIDYDGANCEIWCGSQWPDFDRIAAAGILGILPTQIKFNTLLAGGGFGRRATLGFDYIIEAAQVANAFRVPLKVVWTREDDIQGGYYRPAAVCKLQATLGSDGEITSWGHRVASQTIFVNPIVETGLRLYEEEVQTTQGAVEMPYAIDNVRVDSHGITDQVTVLWMRAVSNVVNVYAVETFFDRLAREAGRDPLTMRRELLQDEPRHLACLEAAAAAMGMDQPAPNGRHRGIALFSSYRSFICQIFEVSVDSERRVTIHKVVSAVDCGIAVNPDLVKAQIESGIVFALSSALFGEITMEDGLVQQSNFHDYPVLRMYQTPEIETVLIPSQERPGGVGELGVPCVAPALANAISAATGEVYDSLPLKNHGLVFA